MHEHNIQCIEYIYVLYCHKYTDTDSQLYTIAHIPGFGHPSKMADYVYQLVEQRIRKDTTATLLLELTML